jgi:hypothetical protein
MKTTTTTTAVEKMISGQPSTQHERQRELLSFNRQHDEALDMSIRISQEY